MPMAVIGIARSFGVEFDKYLSEYGKQLFAAMEDDTIAEVLGAYPGLTWEKLVKPEYAVPEKVGLLVTLANKLIMGTGGTPNAPMFIGQGTGGELEGTSASPVYGGGDGVMIAGDVRALARQYCGAGVSIQYREYPLSHFTSIVSWLPEALAWVVARFTGVTAPNNCTSIAPGNSLAPLVSLEAPEASPIGIARWSTKTSGAVPRVGRWVRVTGTVATGAQPRYVWRVAGHVVQDGVVTKLRIKQKWRGKRVTLVVTIPRAGQAPLQRTYRFGRVR
jgi:hypothetical protein